MVHENVDTNRIPPPGVLGRPRTVTNTVAGYVDIGKTWQASIWVACLQSEIHSQFAIIASPATINIVRHHHQLMYHWQSPRHAQD
jgi:hypothetical protein